MSQGDVALAFARAQIGKPYRFGSTGPDSFDCSGLVYSSWRAAGVKIGRTTAQQIFNGTAVKKADLQPGDLVFPEPTHVQIYAGNGRVVESPHTGAFVREVNMWGFWRARRVGTPGTASGVAGGQQTVTPVADTLALNPLDSIPGIGPIITKFTQAGIWQRAGEMILGALIVLVAIAFVNRAKIASAAGEAAKAGEVAALL